MFRIFIYISMLIMIGYSLYSAQISIENGLLFSWLYYTIIGSTQSIMSTILCAMYIISDKIDKLKK